MKHSETFPEASQFLLEAAPYTRFSIPIGSEAFYYLARRDGTKFDGHCLECNSATTFSLKGLDLKGEELRSISDYAGFVSANLTCAREDKHKIHFWFLIDNGAIEKVGQWPSLADISNDEISQYRRDMDRVDGQEFHKAVGLAAHGVGVGSFVYLRRVFERLIYKRYEESKAHEDWNDTDFKRSKMVEKIKILKDYLPSFLVENAAIYGILSLGVHELSEEECLSFFDVMKQSIIVIIDEDKRKREELEHRTALQQALSRFKPPAMPLFSD